MPVEPAHPTDRVEETDQGTSGVAISGEEGTPTEGRDGTPAVESPTTDTPEDPPEGAQETDADRQEVGRPAQTYPLVRNAPEEAGTTGDEYVRKVIKLFQRIRYLKIGPPPQTQGDPGYSAEFKPFFDRISSTLDADTISGNIVIPEGDSGQQVNFDLACKLFHHPTVTETNCWAELKGYREQTAISGLPGDYDEFLCKCYRSINHVHREYRHGYSFMFIASASFSPSNFTRLKEFGYIKGRLQTTRCTLRIDYEDLDDDKIAKIASNILIINIPWDLLNLVANDD